MEFVTKRNRSYAPLFSVTREANFRLLVQPDMRGSIFALQSFALYG
jgi:hypothetical protein